MNRYFLPIVTLLFLSTSAVSADLESSFRKCAAISSGDDRLKCFDAISIGATTPTALPEDVGLPKTRKQIDPELEESYSVVIADCEASGSTRRVYFHLENGQVWRQKNDKWMSTNKCKSEGTITKDFFGYQLYIKSWDRSIRVSRIR